MALYPREDNEQHTAPEQLTSSVAAIFRACGTFETDARTVAGSLVHAGLRGIHSHGVLRVPDYVRKMTVEGVDPKGQPRVVSETGGTICIDGANSMRKVGGKLARELATERARETGAAFAAVGGSNHCGIMDYYTLPAAENDMIGLAGTNTLPTMAPWSRIGKIVAQFNNSWLTPDFEEVFVPGALEKRVAERNFTDGIPLNAEMLEDISISASRLGVGINLRCKGETT